MARTYNFDDATLLSAFAVGDPGKRTFFVAVGHKDEWVRLWLEKQDLQAMARAIRELLFTVWKNHPASALETGSPRPSEEAPSGLPAAELQISEIQLGHSGQQAVMDMLVEKLGPRQTRTKVHCVATLAQLRQLANQADAVCAAGRPICPLCGEPIDPEGHNCPNSD